MKAASILETIGNTPHVRINRLFGPGANVWIKSERSNPGGSIKDRIALAMVEDAERSGALITADFALDLGRPVLAVPGPAGATMSQGCHHLLRAGAALCERAEDVVAELDGLRWLGESAGPAVPEGGPDAGVFDEVLREPQLVDELAETCGLSTAEIVSALGRLEIEGLVARDALNRYSARGR